jgi:Pentapeptide repeats (8 copies)
MDSGPRLVHPLTRDVLGTILVVLLLSVGLSAAAPGSTSGAAVLRRPGPPTSLRLVAEGDAIVASWSPPVWDGGSPITGYTGTCSIVTGPTSCVLGITKKTQVPVAFHVSAINAVGTGKGATAKALSSNEPDCRYVGPYANLEHCNLAGRDLAGLNLSDSEMGYADLKGADLKGADLLSAQLGYAELTRADLRDATVISNLGGADLTDANLTGARVDALLLNTNLTGANLTDSDMAGSELYTNNHQEKAILTEAVWSNTTCPDGTNSDSDGGTCDQNLGSGTP